jgi:hypothetical protein
MSKQFFILSFIAVMDALAFSSANAATPGLTPRVPYALSDSDQNSIPICDEFNRGRPCQNAGTSFSVISGFVVKLDDIDDSNEDSERAPLVAIFLGPDVPDSVAMHASEAACPQNQLGCMPELHQKFLVGNGKTANGQTKGFRVPEGATRLYFINMDAEEWANHRSKFNIQLINSSP